MLKRAKKLGKIGGSHEMNVKVSESILMIKRAKNLGKRGGSNDFQSK